eukprot:GEMP01013179.1.p1 GENE.GEMP01013179.1~~GEMP01013179.1.p1  ORF type:complete len:669 (+),score=172.68 GEMP01013179.1:277-2283(+)
MRFASEEEIQFADLPAVEDLVRNPGFKRAYPNIASMVAAGTYHELHPVRRQLLSQAIRSLPEASRIASEQEVENVFSRVVKTIDAFGGSVNVFRRLADIIGPSGDSAVSKVKFQRMIRAFSDKEFSIAELGAVFDLCDEDGDGAITLDDFEKSLRFGCPSLDRVAAFKFAQPALVAPGRPRRDLVAKSLQSAGNQFGEPAFSTAAKDILGQGVLCGPYLDVAQQPLIALPPGTPATSESEPDYMVPHAPPMDTMAAMPRQPAVPSSSHPDQLASLLRVESRPLETRPEKYAGGEGIDGIFDITDFGSVRYKWPGAMGGDHHGEETMNIESQHTDVHWRYGHEAVQALAGRSTTAHVAGERTGMQLVRGKNTYDRAVRSYAGDDDDFTRLQDASSAAALETMMKEDAHSRAAVFSKLEALRRKEGAKQNLTSSAPVFPPDAVIEADAAKSRQAVAAKIAEIKRRQEEQALLLKKKAKDDEDEDFSTWLERKVNELQEAQDNREVPDRFDLDVERKGLVEEKWRIVGSGSVLAGDIQKLWHDEKGRMLREDDMRALVEFVMHQKQFRREVGGGEYDEQAADMRARLPLDTPEGAFDDAFAKLEKRKQPVVCRLRLKGMEWDTMRENLKEWEACFSASLATHLKLTPAEKDNLEIRISNGPRPHRGAIVYM